MVVLDFFIVNVALPSIATDLGAGESALEWIVAGYGLTFAAFLITAGRLGDVLGRRRVYAVGLVLFTAASAACGLAPSPETLVAARIAQGAAGAIVMPQVLAIVGVAFRGPDYVRALSIYGVVLGLAAVGGQIIGGVLVESAIGWRGCFLINIPVGIAALACTRFVPESRAEHRAPLDVWSAVDAGDRPDRDPAPADRGPRSSAGRCGRGSASRSRRRSSRCSCAASRGSSTRCSTCRCSGAVASRRGS